MVASCPRFICDWSRHCSHTYGVGSDLESPSVVICLFVSCVPVSPVALLGLGLSAFSLWVLSCPLVCFTSHVDVVSSWFFGWVWSADDRGASEQSPCGALGYQVLLDILFRLGLIANCSHTVQYLDCIAT